MKLFQKVLGGYFFLKHRVCMFAATMWWIEMNIYIYNITVTMCVPALDVCMMNTLCTATVAAMIAATILCLKPFSNGYLLRCTRRVWCTECTVQSPQCSSLFIPLLSVCPMLCMDRISIGICVCVCLSVCRSHFLSTRLQVRPLNGFLQLIA